MTLNHLEISNHTLIAIDACGAYCSECGRVPDYLEHLAA